jgi:hypothetical protein
LSQVTPSTAALRRVIKKLCARGAMTPADLASVLGKTDVANFVRAHLAPMVDAGELERTHPENPTHPRQAYRVIGTGREKP